MSESVSADVGVTVDAPAPVSPAPNTQPSLSISEAVSEAGRTLRSARQPPRPQSAAEAPVPVAEEAPAEAPREAPRRQTGVEAMERALGLKPVEAASEAPQEGDAEPVARGFEFEGRRVPDAEVRSALHAAKDYTFKTQQL